MTYMRLAPAAAPGPRAAWGRLSRPATLGLTTVLLGVAGYALWSTSSTAHTAQQAVDASQVSDDYAFAARAVAAQETLERTYLLQPRPDVRTRFRAASTDLTAALDRVGRHGDPADRARAAQVRADEDRYLAAIDRLFAAVDRGDRAEVVRIDVGETEPAFELMQRTVETASAAHRERALQALADLRSVESFTSRATPWVLLAGLLLVGLFVSVLSHVRRDLDQQRRRAMHDSLHDALTGLPNRMLLSQGLEAALLAGRASGSATGLLLIDVDRFREVNDTLGHHNGDQLLVQIGARLSAVLREVDTVGRLGGDEFAVLLPTVEGVDTALAVAERLRSALDQPFQVEGIDLDVEASIGVVVSGEHGDDPNTLLQRADVAMYMAKEQHSGVCAYDPGLDGNSPQRLALLGQLRRGLDRYELVLHYQPKVSLTTGEVCGAEALVRWQHPERGLVPPDEFIPLAEHTGLIFALTRYVLDAALGQARAWADAGHRMPVAVNLSARNLLDERLTEEVIGLLDRHGLPAEMLELEVTESAIVTDPVRATRLLTRLHELGIRIAIDDFGAGYTSLAQLKALPVTDLKVDRSFVATMDGDRSNAMIVQSVVDLGHNLGLTAVAEGVETEESLAMLAGCGCDVAQGYYFSRPLPAEGFLTWLLKRAPSAPIGIPNQRRAQDHVR
jgi:diguanylate cyclase (GGDEF)-like protein